MTALVRPTIQRRYSSSIVSSLLSLVSKLIVLVVIACTIGTTTIYNPFINQQQQQYQPTTSSNFFFALADQDAAYYEDVGYGDDLSDWDGSDDKFYNSKSSDIKYWTDYAIYPRRCIKYSGIDVIVYSVYDGHGKQCSNDPIGTYYEPVPTYLAGYVQQKYQDTIDQGNQYESPEVLQYAYCVGFYINQVMYYLQAGCADDSTQALAINIYKDNTCTIKATDAYGNDDTNFDVSALQIGFKKCQNCVNWFDMNGNVDDGFYEKRMTEAPLCSTAWASKKTCNRKCQKIGVEKNHGEQGWNASDNMLLIILTTFCVILVGLIIRKRNKMSNKDSLLEQAAMNAHGLQTPHIVGILALVVIVIAVFVLLGLKNVTWALLLILNTALFGYLMKLTVDASANAEVIGPDGSITRNDDSDDDSSLDDPPMSSNNNNNTYNPTLHVGIMSGVGGGGGNTATAGENIENRASATSYVLPTLD